MPEPEAPARAALYLRQRALPDHDLLLARGGPTETHLLGDRALLEEKEYGLYCGLCRVNLLHYYVIFT